MKQEPAKPSLRVGDIVVLSGVSPQLSATKAPGTDGVFVRWRLPRAESWAYVSLGRVVGLKRFLSCWRSEPFWMRPEVGTDETRVPPETQFLLVERGDGWFVLVVPLFGGGMRYALEGAEEGLRLYGETNDPYRVSGGGLALYVGVGREPYGLLDKSARAVMAKLKTGRLRTEKAVPDFVDWFGWCTWDAFYKEVSEHKVLQGLRSFARAGVPPRFVILDDGWQDYQRTRTGEHRLVSFGTNARRFPRGLAPVVRSAKQRFGVKRFLVWHAVNGYWGGVDARRLAGYDTRDAVRSYGREMLRNCSFANQMGWGMLVGLVPAKKIGRFYEDYHQRLAKDGVDGVKVDNQAALEALGIGQGGRIALIEAYRRALESSVHRHFDGRLINCMACNTETFYMASRSTVCRTSIDFWPRQPETHGWHLYTNAAVGLWFGQFVLPDWDMFWSRHECGEYHAVARAISGGPVYVSDKPGRHDVRVLEKLVLHDGSVPRCTDVARLTPDCLFVNPTREPVPLKFFNFNRTAAVVGVFNAQYHARPKDRVTVNGVVSPADVPGLVGTSFAVYAHRAQRLRVLRRRDHWPVRLPEQSWELFTIVPVANGVAVVGLTNKYNSGGTVTAWQWRDDQVFEVNVRDGGELLIYSERSPSEVQVDGMRCRHRYDTQTRGLWISLAKSGSQTVLVRFASAG